MKQVERCFLCARILYARLQIPGVECRKPYLVMAIFCCELRRVGIFDINANYQQVFDKRTREALSKAQILAQILSPKVKVEYMTKNE